MIDIDRGDQENFEKKKIVAKVHKKSVKNPPNPDEPGLLCTKFTNLTQKGRYF